MGKLAKLREAAERAAKTLDDYATRQVWHGTPHEFAAERLVRMADGTEQWIVGSPGVLPDVPAGAEVLQDAPLGRFRLEKMGTGEGAQAYGAGGYVSESKSVASSAYRHGLTEYGYRRASGDLPPMEEFAFDMLSQGRDDIELYKAMKLKYGENATNTDEFWNAIDNARAGVREGALYKAEIPTADYMIDWDKPLSQQSQYVREKLGIVTRDFDAEDRIIKEAQDQGIPVDQHPEYQRLLKQIDDAQYYANKTGAEYYRDMALSAEGASEVLKKKGIVGINYIGDSSGVRNAVVFDDNLIRILEKGNVDPRLLAPLAAGAAGAGYAASAFQGPAQMPTLDPRYAEFEQRRAQKRDIWRQLKEATITLGSAIGGGIIADASRLGGYLNPWMDTQSTEQGAQAIENAMFIPPTQQNAILEGLGKGIQQAQEDFAPLTYQLPESIPGRIYNALPERAQGVLRIGADYAF